LRAPGLGAIAEQSLELPERLPALRLGVGADEIRQAFDPGEIELAVLESAARELAGFGGPATGAPPERRQDGGDHRPAPVQLQLGRVLAGLAAWTRKPQRQRL